MPKSFNLQNYISGDNTLAYNGQGEKPDVVGEIKKIPGIDIMPTGIDTYVLPYLFDFILGVDNISSGVYDFFAGGGETLIGTSREQQLKNKESRDLRKPFAIQAIKQVDELISNKYIDETGRQLDVADLFREEEWGYMAELGFQSAMNSAPSTIISVINPLLGGAILGASTAGGKYYEDLKNRPDESVNSIIFNSILAGGSEWATEYLGGRYLSGLGDIGGKTTTKAVKEYTQSFVKSFFTKVIGGALSESVTEAVNAVVQESGNVLFYEDEVSQKKYIDHVINAVVPAMMLGGKGGAMASFTPKSKENLYKIAAPKKWKQEFFTVSKKIHDVTLDISKANPNEKKELQEELDNLIKQRDKKISDLTASFENLTDKELIEYAKNLDKTNKNLDKIGNNKFSETTQERAEQENLKLLQENFDLIGREYTAEDIETEKIIGETLKASEIIEQRLGKLKGINRDDLDVVIIKKDKDLDKLSNKNKEGVKNSDGAFIGKNKDGKATIYINQQVAALAGATNVVGHELLHYMVSRKFKTDNKSMEPLIGDLKDYLQKNHSEVYSKVQKRIDNFYTDKKTGKIKEGALEEYLNVFSDLISKQKINISKSGSKGFTKELKDVVAGFGFGSIKLDTAEDVISFLSTYEKNINRKGLLGKLMGTKILDIGLESSKLQKNEETKKQDDTLKKSKSKAVDAVNEMEKGVKTKEEFQNPKVFNNVYNSIVKKNGAINNYVKSLGLSKEKFQETIDELGDRLMNYDPAAKRKTKSDEPITVGEFLMANVGYSKLEAAKALAIESKRKDKERPTDLGETTKEGDIKMQVEDTDTSAQEVLDEQDMSLEGIAKREAKENKAKKKRYSKFRQILGFETDGDTYNAVLDAARKSILLAYGKTQKITDSKARVDKIVDLIKKEYNSLNSDLFKPLKDFLGTKEYLNNLRKFREAIVESISTADLVQMEKFTPDSERIFTTFVKKLTKKSDVKDAVNKNLLPKDALNTIDKGEAVNLYQKVMPNPNEFIGFADQPAINPITKQRSGLKGTRKDGFAKRIGESLILDAVMEVRQEADVQQTLTEDLGAQMDIQQLASKIGREVEVKFSKSNADNVINYDLKNSSVKFSKMSVKQRDKTIQKLAIEIDKFKEDSSQRVLYENLLLNLNKFKSYEEAVNVTIENTNEKFGGEVAFEIKSVLSKGVLTKENVNSIVDSFKNITLEELRIESLPLLAKAYNKIFTDPNISVDQKISVLLNFVGIVGRSTRSGKNTPLKTNKELYSWIEKNLKLPTEIQDKLEVKTFDGYGKKNISKILYDGKEINKYLHTDSVRSALTSNNDKQTILETMRSQAKEAFSTMLNILNKESRFTLEEKLAFIERTFLDQMGMMRKTYPPGFYMFGENYNAKNTKLEHNPPVAEAKEIWKQYAKGQISEQAVLDWYKNNNASVNVISNEIDNILKEEGLSQSRKNGENRMEHPRIKPILESENKKGNIGDYKKQEKEYTLENLEKVNNLISFSKSTKNPKKGITILDFDDTLATSSSLIKFTRPDNTKGTLTPEQYASTYEDLLGLNYKFDFSEFNKVVDGKPAPLLNKAKKLAGKFGTDNMFILTARPAESAVAIQKFLKENGLDIPLKNITGLGNSTADAKALWVLDKANEGFNDFYFADDAIQNVKAVQNMLDQIDVKSKVQQARVKFSKSMNEDFNNILEDVSGIDSIKRFSEAKGKRRGKSKGKFRYFVPPSHEDFIGLLYNFMGKGKQGNEHRSFFEQALVRPLNRAYRELNAAKQTIANEYRALIKGMPIVSKKLGKKILDGDFTNEDAIRVYLWDKFGFKIPGLSETDQKQLSDFVKDDPMLQSFADMIGTISKDKEGYVKPSDNWDAGGIKYDLIDATGRIGRAQFFQEFIENADIIFSKENLNKIEAIYGADFRSAVEDMLYRVKNGTNRPTGTNKMVNGWMDWINGSIGATMFFNARSALLQQLSFVNFMNFSDNNMFKAAARFANQKQFWSDFAMIFNSDYLKQRRSGAGFDVNASEIAREVSGAVNPARAAIRYLLNLGFLPTQMGDSFAIAIGGASFYRNRVATYLKEGLSQKEAEGKAFIDFQQIAEATQQSARPDMISQQQASVLGRFVLAFQNVTSQYARIIKKSTADIVKRRVSPGYKTQGKSDMANVSRIMYYGAVQSVIFYGLQTALFAMMFDDDEKDEEFFDKKKDRIINGTIDSLLRGAGVLGAVISTVKNYVIKVVENSKSDSWFNSPAWPELLSISPPISIKQRKISGGERTADWNKDVIKEMEVMDIDNPLWDSVTSTVEGFTNIPLNRLYKKVQNLRAAQDSENAWWQRVAVALGWSKWDVGIENKKVDEVKKKIKKDKSNKKKTKEDKKEESINIKKQKQEKKEGKKDIKCAATSKSGNRCKTTIEPGKSYCTIHEKVTQNKSGKKSQCKKIKKDKKRCGMQTNSKSGYCYYHD